LMMLIVSTSAFFGRTASTQSTVSINRSNEYCRDSPGRRPSGYTRVDDYL
jgi:hypothetical protein